MDGRTIQGDFYRYGYQGSEKDDESKGGGNSYTTYYRQLDTRVGRFLTLDPLSRNLSGESPYSSNRNNPILYLDIKGNKWVNVHEEKVKQIQQKLIDSPNDKQLLRQLNKEQNKANQLNQVIETIKENDYFLWAYIENLQMSHWKTGECLDVNVRIELKKAGDSPIEGAKAATIDHQETKDGKSRFASYESLEKFNEPTDPYDEAPFGRKTPINDKDEIGINIELYFLSDLNDVRLANEIGDVMYIMEYPLKSNQSGSDLGKNYNDYSNYGTAGGYSFTIDGIYEHRKKTGKGKESENNPYPLVESEENYKKYSGQ